MKAWAGVLPFMPATLMRSLGIVDDEIAVENSLHLGDGFEPGPAALDTEVFVEKGAMEPLDDAVGLRTFDPGCLVLDVLELKEELVRMAIGSAAELAAIV